MGMAIAMILLLLLLFVLLLPNDIERRLFCILGVNGAADMDEGDMDDDMDEDVIASTSLRTLSSIIYR